MNDDEARPQERLEQGCKVAGCSNQLCIEEDAEDGGITICEWKEEYACYQTATCARQSDGACGWTLTEELEACLREHREPPAPGE